MKISLITKSISIFALLLIAILVQVIALLHVEREVQENDRWVSHTHHVIHVHYELLTDLLNAETGQRGYLLTSKEEYLEPYVAVIGEITEKVDELLELTHDNPRQQQRLQQIVALVDAKIKELNQTISLSKEGKPELAAAVVDSDQGKQLMDSIRSELDEFEEEEKQLLQDRKTKLTNSKGLFSFIYIGISLFMGVLLALALLHFYKRVLIPLAQLTEDINRISKGGHSELECDGDGDGDGDGDEVQFLHNSFCDMQRKVEKSNQDLLDSLKGEQKANRVKDEFLASMSHELRTPLTSIIGNSEFMLDEGSCGGIHCPHKDAENILNSIQSAGKNQLALVNDILDMSKIESGKFTIDEAPYNLSLLMNELERMFSVKAADAGIRFVIDQKNQESHLLMGDAQRISQVLINLIGNAIKFTEQGEVRLTSWVHAGNLIFQVKDSGIGMSREVLDNLFQQFHQADGSISRRFGGTGLGLYISENLADLMGGTIDVSSEEGAGSIFQLTIPYQPTETRLESSGTGNKQSVMDETISGHILIAEDTPELQLLEKRVLESIGLTVTTAADGQEAIDQVNQNHFDLILMDMQMPNVDGIEATRSLRGQGHTLPIVALTANVMQKHRDAFNEAGCDDFLGKPIDKNELRKVLKQHLPKEQLPQTSAEEEVDDELMAIFMESNIQRVATLKQALTEKDWQQVREVAHAIKGSAASFGYPQLSEMAEQLQRSIDEGQLDEVVVMTESLLVELDKLLR